MAVYSHGWCGRILEVDLSNRRFSERETRIYAKNYLGGRGVATRLYWDLAHTGVAAFAPEKPLILMSGPLGATGAQGASRFVVAGNSPMRHGSGAERFPEPGGDRTRAG